MPELELPYQMYDAHVAPAEYKERYAATKEILKPSRLILAAKDDHDARNISEGHGLSDDGSFIIRIVKIADCKCNHRGILAVG